MSPQRRSQPSTELVVRSDGTLERVQRRPLPARLFEAAIQPLPLVALGIGVAAQLALGVTVLVTIVLFVAALAGSWVRMRSHSFSSDSYRAREAVVQLPPTLRTRVRSVLLLVERVHADLRELDYPPEGVHEGLDELVAMLVESARQAARVDQYLGTVKRPQLETDAFRARQRAVEEPHQLPIAQALEEQLTVVDELHRRRQALDTQIEQLAAHLGVMHARVVQARIESEQLDDMSGEILQMRDRTRAMADALREVRQVGTTS